MYIIYMYIFIRYSAAHIMWSNVCMWFSYLSHLLPCVALHRHTATKVDYSKIGCGWENSGPHQNAGSNELHLSHFWEQILKASIQCGCFRMVQRVGGSRHPVNRWPIAIPMGWSRPYCPRDVPVADFGRLLRRGWRVPCPRSGSFQVDWRTFVL